MDEATIRMILDGGGGGQGPGGPPQSFQAQQPTFYGPGRGGGPTVRVPGAGAGTDSDPLLAIAHTMRGTLSGIFGSLAGTAIDLFSALRRLRAPQQPPVPPAPQVPTVYPVQPPTTTLQGPPNPIPTVYPVAPRTTPPAGASQAAAGGASNALALAGAAGIAAAVFIALQKVRDALVGAVHDIGTFSSRLISPNTDPSVPIEAAGNALESFSDKLFYISPALGMFGGVVGAATTEVARFMRTIDGFVERYAPYSPQLSVGLALADVQQTLGDLRRAQQATPELLRYLQVRTELQQKFEDTKVRILTRILPMVTRSLETLEKIWPLVETQLNITTMLANASPLLQLNNQLSEILIVLNQMNAPGGAELPSNLVMAGQFPFELVREGAAERPEGRRERPGG